MIQFETNLKSLQRGFLDREAVMRRVDRATRRNMMRFGGRTRTIARRSLRRRKRTSDPGQPPSIHTSGNQNLKFILFAYQSASQSILVGPLKFNGGSRHRSSSKTVPELQEEGGSVAVTEQRFGKAWLPVDAVPRRARGKGPTRRRTVNYPPRPFMQPAFKKSEESLPSDWRNSISR